MRIAILLASCLLTACASAPPPAPVSSFPKRPPAQVAGDPLGRFLTEKGLIEQLNAQIEQSRDMLGNKASDLVIGAMGYLGVPYQRGGNRFDEGLTAAVLSAPSSQQSAGLPAPAQSRAAGRRHAGN